MGLFNFGKKAENSADKPVEKVNLKKVQKINLRKEEVSKIIDGISVLKGVKARVALVLDYSGSMDTLYNTGVVQETIEKMLPLAMNFDDDGNMEAWIFDDGFHRLPDINMGNFDGFVNREILHKYDMGCTNYAPVIKDIAKRYITEEPAKVADYVIFITDGNNGDAAETDKVMIEVSKSPIFFQFVGLGNAKFTYLQKLDDMEGRYVDNADFFAVKKAEDISYENLLNEFPSWLANEKVQGMLR